jgi:hypothetical protein
MMLRRLARALVVTASTFAAVSDCGAVRRPPVVRPTDSPFARAIATYADQVDRMRAAETLDALDVDGALQALSGALDEIPYANRVEAVAETLDLVEKRIATYELFAPGSEDRDRLEATQQMLELVAIGCIRLADERYGAAPSVRGASVVLQQRVHDIDPRRPLRQQRAPMVAAFEQVVVIFRAMDDALRSGVVRPPAKEEGLVAR